MGRCVRECCEPISQRFVVATVVLSALAMQYIHRSAFSLAITEMTYKLKVTEESLDEVCPYNKTSKSFGDENKLAEFHWTAKEQEVLISIFYLGYILTHLPGGILADKYGPKTVMGYGVAISGICSLLTPITARTNMYLLITLRILMGAAQGPLFPAQSVFVARWSLPHERNMMNSYMNVGVVLGSVLGNACTGFMLSFLDKWDIVFYIYSGLTVIWFIFWIIFAYDSFESHPFISEKEQNKLECALQNEVHKEYETDYCAVIRSVPVWAMIIAAAGHDWAFFIIISLLPQYISYVLLFDVLENGIINCLPYIAMLVVQLSSAKLAEKIVTNGYMSKTNQCKLFFFLTNQGPVACFLAASYAGCQRVLVIALFTLSMAFMGCVYSCVRVVNVDLAPNFAGFLMALMNGIGAICGLLAPPVFSLFITEQTVTNWRQGFILSAVFISLTTVVFLIWGSSELQPWNNPSSNQATSPEQRERESLSQ